MILNMLYASATFMIIRTYLNDEINVKITSLQDNRQIQFQNFRQDLKMKYLSHLFSDTTFKEKKD